jgi:SAM-dependent methyltransferase
MSGGLDPGVPADLRQRLTAYYDAEARTGARTRLSPRRVAMRRRFIDLLRIESRTTVLDVGAGPGHDVIGFAGAGFAAVGADLSIGNARLIGAAGVNSVVASLWHLPFAAGRFDAVWTMSTLVHVPDDRLDDALVALLAVVRPGGPVGIGTWGGRDGEGVSGFTRIDPPRFFALRGHDRMLATLERHGEVEHWETDGPEPTSGWEYQFAVVRRVR